MAQPTTHDRSPLNPGLGAAWLFCVLTALSGCAASRITGELDYPRDLVTGERLFGEALSPDELPSVAINAPSEAMRSYIAATIEPNQFPSRRFLDLFSTLTRDGYFEAVYSADSTLTAAETFEAHGGNCLSYTNMFVALAREAGLDARYQVVDTPASWDADSGFLIRYTHINVLLKNVRLDNGPGTRDGVIVDFNDVHPDPDYRRKVVTDEYAESLFYANRSVKLLREGQTRAGFAHLRRALEVAPGNVDLWINLGAFYATLGDYASSLEAYQVALQLDPRHKPAFSGLARNYRNLGNHPQADLYDQKVRNYRERNPYYHYALAQAAYEISDYELSLDYINTAIGLKRRIPRFHLFKGLVEQQLGEPEAAEASFLKAQRYGLDRDVKLDMLRSMAGVTAS
jgi:hypothetical protein